MSEREATFENAKTGDRCYSPLFKSVNADDKTNAIISIENGVYRCVVKPDIGNGTYGFKIDGSYSDALSGQVLFWENPIKEIPTRPKRKVIKKGFIGVIPAKNGSYLANTTNIHTTREAIAEILINCKHQIIPVEFDVYE